ncbi:uncharacterized protein LOC119457114 [Dermacentor silvarum]|uniref:uncharacterized protein LOC119457114 n=1 Tax=Dermacentor silvarum TaxID=543639 RepID=UPI0021011A67|nr:uncharacterized protein LOC119457114 [Dermacentor silvarum]
MCFLPETTEKLRTFYGVAAVSVHTRDTSIPHVHVVHDCSWSNGSCRCVSFSGFVRRPNRSSVWTTSATAWDFFHLIQYLYSHPRVLEYFKVGGADWGRDCRAQVVGQYGHSGHESSRVLEVLHSQFACPVACNDTIGSSSGYSNGDSLCKREGGKAKARKCSKRKAEEPLYDWLRENPVSPLTNIVRTPKWLADPNFGFIRLDDKHLQRAIQVFNDEMCSYTTLDFIELYKNTQPLFDAPQGDLSAYYMNIEESFDAVLELLSFQFDDNQPEISDFVNNLYMLVEKLVPKKNCLEEVSPPSAGKNFLFDAVLSFYINRGTIRNFNRYSNCPLQDTVGRRILVWNEPNCESSAFDTVKKIFGGDVDSVAVKYSPDQTISRTPVIVLSNNEVFPDDDAFNHRIRREGDRTAGPKSAYQRFIATSRLPQLPRDTFRIIVRPRDDLNVAKSTPVQVEQALAMAAALAPQDITEDSICPNRRRRRRNRRGRSRSRGPSGAIHRDSSATSGISVATTRNRSVTPTPERRSALRSSRSRSRGRRNSRFRSRGRPTSGHTELTWADRVQGKQHQQQQRDASSTKQRSWVRYWRRYTTLTAGRPQDPTG